MEKELKCPNCGNVFEEDQLFCGNCGTKRPDEHTEQSVCKACGAEIAPEQAFCQKCGEPVEAAAKMFCSNCGTEMSRDQRYCPKCGQQASSPLQGLASDLSQSDNLVDAKKKRSKDGVLYLMIAVAAGVLLFVKGFFTNESQIKIYSSTTRNAQQSYKALVTYTHDFLILIPILICVLLAVIIVLSWVKDRKPKLNIVNMICSGFSFATVLISSLICSGKYEFQYSDYFSDYGLVSMSNSFDSFGVLFYAELLLLVLLFVLSLLNYKGKKFIK